MDAEDGRQEQHRRYGTTSETPRADDAPVERTTYRYVSVQ